MAKGSKTWGEWKKEIDEFLRNYSQNQNPDDVVVTWIDVSTNDDEMRYYSNPDDFALFGGVAGL